MPRITLMLSRAEEEALIQLAIADLRVPNVEARFLLREELVRRGMLKAHLVPIPNELPTVAPTRPSSAQDTAESSKG